MKVVINNCFGGFGLSPKATLRLYELGCPGIATHVDEYWPPAERAERDERYSSLGYAKNLAGWREHLANPEARRSLFQTVFSPDEQYVLRASDIARNDPLLLQVIEEMGDEASDSCAKLKVVEIPDGVDYVIEEYDGNEHIAEKRRTWS